MLEYARTNPFRPANWRWLRAVGRYDGTQPPPSRTRDGQPGFRWIKRALRFKTEYDNALVVGQYSMCDLAEKWPDIFWAHNLYQGGANAAIKSAVEAYFLARQSDFEIGLRCGLPPQVVEAYEALFFNVREKLIHPEYILHTVIGAALQQTLSDRTFDPLWKLYGYFCGPHFLAGLISKFPSPVWCQTPDAMSAAIQDDAISTLKLKAAVAAKTVTVSRETQLALMEQFTKFVEVERTTESQGRAQDQILGHIQALFAALPFQVGEPRAGVDMNPTAEYDHGSIELTFEETMKVSARQVIPNAGLLKQLTFPTTLMSQQNSETARLEG